MVIKIAVHFETYVFIETLHRPCIRKVNHIVLLAILYYSKMEETKVRTSRDLLFEAILYNCFHILHSALAVQEETSVFFSSNADQLHIEAGWSMILFSSLDLQVISVSERRLIGV